VAKVRRWDQHETADTNLQGGAIPIRENRWIDLEAGVQVWFDGPADPTASTTYRSGDYWLIPARTALADVIWPDEPDPAASTTGATRRRRLPPAGVRHQYAPVAVLSPRAGGGFDIKDLRRSFPRLLDVLVP
jgi:hypothetical protein